MKISTAKRWWLALNIASVIGPLIAIGAAYTAYRAAQNNTDEQYVTLAINILREGSKEGQGSASDKALRGWATDVLVKYSEVRLPANVIADLRSGKITLAGAGLAGEASDTSRGEGTVRP